MEKKRKEKSRSEKTNENNQTNLSVTRNISQHKNSDIKTKNSTSKRNQIQHVNDKNDFFKENKPNENKNSEKNQKSNKKARNQDKKQIKTKNNETRKSKSSQNKTLSPTNIILQSRIDFSDPKSKMIDLDEENYFEENIFRNNSMDFSPIKKKEIKLSPQSPCDNIEYDIEKNLQKEFDISDNFDDKDDLDSNHGNNSSFTQLFTSKCDLKAELQAAVQVNKQLKQRDANLQKRIQDLNEQSQVALQVLEDRLSELREENIQLIDLLDRLPSEERLIIEYNQLTTFPIEEEDIEPLIDIGILEEGENITDLKERLDDMIAELRYYESKYDIVAQYGEDGFMTKFFLSYFDDSNSRTNDSNNNSKEKSEELKDEKLAKELKHKIDLLEKSSDSSVKIARKKLAKLEKEVDLLRKNVQDKKFISNHQPSEPSSMILNQTGVFSLQDIKNVLVTAGGDKNKLKQINGNTFSYGNPKKEIKFEVESICGRPYAISSKSTRKVSLFTFFKSII